MTLLRSAWAWLDDRAGWLLLGGLGLVALWNWRAWRRDRALIQQLRDKEPEPVALASTPRVSLLVAAWNEAEIIRRHVESFLALRYPNRELILCAGGTDGTYKAALQYAGEGVTLLLQQPGEGKQAALRRCLDRATGEIVFLTDADCLLDNEAFERTLAPLTNEGERVATGSRRPLTEQLRDPFVVYQWYYHGYCAARHPIYVAGIEGRNLAMRTELLKQLGGFQDPVPVGTDYHLARKLLAQSCQIRYVADSEISTCHASSYGEYWQQQSRWQRNVILHGVKFGAWTEVWAMVQRGLIGLLMLGIPIAGMGMPRLMLSLWGILFAQALMARVRYVEWGREVRSETGFRSPGFFNVVLYVFVDLVAWVRGWLDLLSPKSRWKW